MEKTVLYIAVIIVFVHGLIHLVGFVAYWPLTEISQLPYKTTVLNGRWEIGRTGVRYVSVFWLIAAIGFFTAAIGILIGREWWLPVLVPAIVLSAGICILDWNTAWRGFIVDLGILVVSILAWGLRVQAEPFSAYPQSTRIVTTTPLPADLPSPVARFYRIIMAGNDVPKIESAVITARGSVRFAGITFPSRLRFTHDAGSGYRHYIESLMFGRPLMKVNEWYLGGRARMELPVGIVENEPKIDMAANLGLWGESIWLPSIFVTDSRVRWEEIDDTSARLVVPFADRKDTFTARFDPETGLLISMEAMRYREATDETKTSWQLDFLSWDTFHGILIPSSSTVTWADQGIPWLTVNIDDVAYNVAVEDYIRAEGL